MRSLILLMALPLAFAACGGKFTGIDNGSTSGGPGSSSGSSGSSSGSSGGSSGSSGGSSGSSGGGSFAGGSIDLTFQNVTQTQGGGLFGTPPSQGHSFRVDFSQEGLPWAALLTPRWGDSTLYQANVGPTSIVLTGKGAYSENASTDTWQTITLTRAADGSVASGSFTAAGTEQQSNGDVVGQGSISATGTFTVDLLAPEAKIGAASPQGPDGMLLPWDPIPVRIAEPVIGSSDLFGGLTLDAASGSVGLTWDTPEAVPAPFAGIFAGTAHRTTFTPVGAAAAGWIAPNISDLVGHTLTPLKQPITFLDLPIVSTSHTFDSDVVTAGTWGPTQWLGGKTADPNCESGGCAQIGQFQDGYCNTPRVGMAVRLDMKSAKSVAIRYRVLASLPGGGTTYPPTLPAAFVVQIAPIGGTATTSTVNATTTDLKQLTTPVLGMAWGTDWTTFTAPKAAVAEAGVAIIGGTGPNGGPCGLVPAPSNVIILVDSIVAN